ncbi:sentrin-specific protease 7 isoform X2 [Chiloscyllium punctatum]|uniref:sentrin-specific protease 7 isoform X2 n=1 Tax=Chiloscyllium punctatum TaxID=137246 RepID=UPI003B6357CA
MDRRRASTQPAGQDGPGTLKSGDKFKIPKKKKVTEKDNVETHSPLSRLTDSRIENLRPSHKRWPFSYNTFNKTRNRDSIAYSQRRKSHSKHNFQGDDVQLKGVQSEKRLECSISEQSENVTRPKESSTSPGRISGKDDKGIYAIEQTEKRGQLCEQNKINKGTSTESPLSSPKKKRLYTNLQDHSNQKDVNSAAPSQKYGEDLLKKMLVCLTCKEQTENCHCFSTDINNGQELDVHFMEIAQVESCLQQEQLSPLRQQNSKYVDRQLVDADPSVPDGNFYLKESLHTSVTNEQKLGEAILNTPMLSSQVKHLKSTVVSSEPIVLSSDEEDTDKIDSRIHCTTLTPEIKCLRLGSRLLSTESNKRDSEIVSARLEPENIKGAHEAIEKNTLLDMIQSMDYCLENNFAMTETTMDLAFAAVHMEEINGNEQGSVKFSRDNIAISFSGPCDINHSLLLDTFHLKKYSLFDTVCESHSVIFLWFAADYIDELNKLLQTSSSKHGCNCNEFIFIQLFKPLQATEIATLKKIMTDIGEKNETTDLCDIMSLDETYQLLSRFSSEQSSFRSLCYKTLQEQMDMATFSQESHLSQEENASSMKSNNYTLCHIRRKDQYMVSIASKQEKEKHIFKQSGPVQKIIVFPPPPTKGGLAVTTEDLECLEAGEFLNDVIIDFYLKYLLLEKAPKELAERTHIFSSFFYRRLTRKDNAGSEEATNLSIQHKRHQRVRTWTRHVDIFTKDFIFVPVNEESHWYLAVICFPALDKIVYETDVATETKASKLFPNPSSTHSLSEEKTSKEQESSSDESDGNTTLNSLSQDSTNIDSSSVPSITSVSSTRMQGCIKAPINRCQQKRILKQPCILIMDSLRAASQLHTVKILREYLQIEWEVKKRGQRSFTAETMKGSVPRVPKQDNSSDCGIYLLQYVESFFQKPITSFELPLQLDNWFLREEVKKKREEIKDLILQLHSQQRTDN